MSFLADTNPDLDLAGVVGFHAGLDLSWLGIPGPLDRAADIRGPLLGLFGGADEHIPPEQVDEFDRRLADAGAEHEIVVYPGAPHSFFDRVYAEHAEACEDAWRRTLGFLDAVRAPA
jgi:carboxymethylenebutenolidase